MKTADVVRKKYEDTFNPTRSERTVCLTEEIHDEGRRLMKEGRYADVDALFSAQGNIDWAPFGLKTRQAARIHLRDYEGCHEDGQKAYRILKHEVSAVLCNDAAASIEQGEFDAAIAFSRQARSEDPCWHLPWANEGSAHLSKDDLSATWAMLDQMLEVWPQCRRDERMAWHLYHDGIFAILRAVSDFQSRVVRYTELQANDVGGIKP
jgi:hypothetical protein